MLHAGPPSLHYYCAVVLHSCIVLPPVGHSSIHQYHCCQLTDNRAVVRILIALFKFSFDSPSCIERHWQVHSTGMSLLCEFEYFVVLGNLNVSLELCNHLTFRGVNCFKCHKTCLQQTWLGIRHICHYDVHTTRPCWIQISHCWFCCLGALGNRNRTIPTVTQHALCSLRHSW